MKVSVRIDEITQDIQIPDEFIIKLPKENKSLFISRELVPAIEAILQQLRDKYNV